MLLFLLYWKINKVLVKSSHIVSLFKKTTGVAILQMNRYFCTVYLITVKLRGEICINEI